MGPMQMALLTVAGHGLWLASRLPLGYNCIGHQEHVSSGLCSVMGSKLQLLRHIDNTGQRHQQDAHRLRVNSAREGHPHKIAPTADNLKQAYL